MASSPLTFLFFPYASHFQKGIWWWNFLRNTKETQTSANHTLTAGGGAYDPVPRAPRGSALRGNTWRAHGGANEDAWKWLENRKKNVKSGFLQKYSKCFFCTFKWLFGVSHFYKSIARPKYSKYSKSWSCLMFCWGGQSGSAGGPQTSTKSGGEACPESSSLQTLQTPQVPCARWSMSKRRCQSRSFNMCFGIDLALGHLKRWLANSWLNQKDLTTASKRYYLIHGSVWSLWQHLVDSSTMEHLASWQHG